MSSLAFGRRERRDERAARRHLETNQTIPRARRSRASGHLLLCASLAAGAFFALVPSGQVLAVNEGVVNSAALTTGLQGAERLDLPTPREPVQPSQVQVILDRVNAERTARGIAPVALHDQLNQAAQAHAADQFYRDCYTQLSHTGTDGSNTGDRIARTGLRVRTWGENIACGQPDGTSVMNAWMNSSGHRANILNSSFTHIGISTSRDSAGRLYWVQVFGTPR